MRIETAALAALPPEQRQAGASGMGSNILTAANAPPPGATGGMLTLEDLKAMLAKMPPEERDALLQGLYADYPSQERNLEDRGGYAQELRGTPAPGMRDAGRFKVAANPMEFLATAGSRGLGDYGRRQVEQERAAMGGRRENALATLVRGMMGERGGVNPSAGAGRPPPMGAPRGPGAGPGMGAASPQAIQAAMLRGR